MDFAFGEKDNIETKTFEAAESEAIQAANNGSYSRINKVLTIIAPIQTIQPSNP